MPCDGLFLAVSASSPYNQPHRIVVYFLYKIYISRAGLCCWQLLSVRNGLSVPLYFTSMIYGQTNICC